MNAVEDDNVGYMQDATNERPPFLSSRWSGFGCAGVGCLSYALFAIAQIVAFTIVLFKAHPDAPRLFTTVPPPHDLQQTLLTWTTQLSTAQNLFVFAVVGDGIMIVVALVLARFALGANPRQLGLSAKVTPGQIFTGVLIGIALVIVSQIVTGLQAKLFGPHPEAVAELLKTHHGTISFLFDLASVCAIAPFAEELLFRGVVFAGLSQRMPLFAAALLSGLIFGAAHLDRWNIAPLAVIGVGLAYLYYRTGSLWPNIAAHATVNAVALIAVYYLPQYAG